MSTALAISESNRCDSSSSKRDLPCPLILEQAARVVEMRSARRHDMGEGSGSGSVATEGGRRGDQRGGEAGPGEQVAVPGVEAAPAQHGHVPDERGALEQAGARHDAAPGVDDRRYPGVGGPDQDTPFSTALSFAMARCWYGAEVRPYQASL